MPARPDASNLHGREMDLVERITALAVSRGKVANFGGLTQGNVTLFDDNDGTGSYIADWNTTTLGPWPVAGNGFTDDELRRYGSDVLGDNYVSPPIPTRTPVVDVFAQVRLVVDIETGELTSMGVAVGFGGAMSMDVNVFWIFFDKSQADTNYIEFVQMGNGPNGEKTDFDVTTRELDFIEITVTDRTGNPITPLGMSLSIQRATV